MKCLVKEKLSAHKYKDNNGYLICVDSVLARTGKQTYLRSEIFADAADDNTEVEVDRKPEEVFSEKTLASFENCPLCVEHPDEDINPDNYKDYAVGFVRDVHRGVADGQDVILGTLVITDAQTIKEIENGEHTDLSCGYDCDIDDSAHPQQRNIRGNHVALCEQGRAGNARIVDTAEKVKDDKIIQQDGDWVIKKEESRFGHEYIRVYYKGREVQEFDLDDYDDENDAENEARFWVHAEKRMSRQKDSAPEPTKEMYEFIKKHPDVEKEVNKMLNQGIEWNSAVNFAYIEGKKKYKDSVKDSERYLIRKDSGAGEIVYETDDLKDAIAELKSLGKSFYIDDTQENEKIDYWKAVKMSDSVKDMPYNGQSQVKEKSNGFAIVLQSRWDKYGVYSGIEAWEPTLEAAKYHRDRLQLADGLDFVVIDCSTKRLMDSKKCKDFKYEFDGSQFDINELKEDAARYGLDVLWISGKNYLVKGRRQDIADLLKEYNMDYEIRNITDSKMKDVEPRAGESKEDFIARFMKETKNEYPDEKQRLAVAYSYWEKKDMKDSSYSIYTLQSDRDKNLIIYIGNNIALKEGLFGNKIVHLDKSPEQVKKDLLENGWHEIPNKKIMIDSVKDDIYTIRQHNGNWYYEIKYNDGFTKLVGPYNSMEEAIKYFKQHRPNEKLSDEETTAEKVTEKLEKGFESFKESRMKDDSDLTLLREFFKERQPSRKMELRNKLKSMGYEEGISGVDTSELMWVKLNGKKYEVKNLSSVRPLDSIKDAGNRYYEVTYEKINIGPALLIFIKANSENEAKNKFYNKFNSVEYSLIGIEEVDEMIVKDYLRRGAHLIDSVNDAKLTYMFRYKDLYHNEVYSEEIKANSVNEAIEELRKRASLRGIGTANVYVNHIDVKETGEYYPFGYGKLNSLTIDSKKLVDAVKIAKIIKNVKK